MYPDLKGKRVVITGAASGIGLATAKRFVEEGSRVFIIDVNEQGLKKVLRENPGISGGAVADVSSPDQVSKAFSEVERTLGGLDVLIANAGISYRTPFLKISYEEWKRVIDVNLTGPFLCAKEAIRMMEKQREGVILFTASTNGMRGHPYYAHYNASKAGLILLAKTLALEFAPWLKVVAVCPGYVLTPMQLAEYTPEMIEEVNKTIPIGRHASPEEIAALFAFLASKESSYITGSCVVIDGGETAR
ncbi:MAG: oxidoreductase [Thermoproteota archaeon]|jgi:NAD(P)-dependent dehydrogenase (short-subunit alcohol dehydrogenase family)|uniref:SDR family oxidoreductase n=1 Tax=Candidatus Methanodesulfokora washburnensis TaxID=2478471 RepID=A0A429GSK8_9CREN|nr:SDR family oxidoreductase [Candidatus Methanodesulfokores washburnensis]RSN76906.1 SDR family oxidoreductase [Candidatus Methanodesulfokores washburnensis]RZN62653.1 MAG: SDR family oxidoreductase [Candidatus Methanodesulfokores washburnensis]TDA40845.1 MAG: oxidoreductase [Candidatus Korarchaeota archaeon]